MTRWSGSSAVPVAVSVILSTRNRAHYLPEVLRSLAAQRCEVPFEVIVIDNASTDDTASVLEAWCLRDARFVTAHETRVGLSRGKNAGVRMARAPLLLFTDDDTRVVPQWVAAHHESFGRCADNLVVSGGPIVPIAHDLGPWPEWLAEPALSDAGLLHHRTERVLGPGEYVWGGNMAVPRRLFDRFGLWDEAIGLQGDRRVTREDSAFFEDTEFQDRIRAAGGQVRFCPAAVVYHRVDRRTVTPRRVSSSAFARGRNEVWTHALASGRGVQSAPRRNGLAGLLALAGSLAGWGLWVILFRLSPRQAAFERARRAAFASGHALDGLRAGRTSMWLFRGAARVAFAARGVLLRSTPDVP